MRLWLCARINCGNQATSISAFIKDVPEIPLSHFYATKYVEINNNKLVSTINISVINTKSENVGNYHDNC
jgi:hypothetical protein